MKSLAKVILVFQIFLAVFYISSEALDSGNLYQLKDNYLQESEHTIDVLHQHRFKRDAEDSHLVTPSNCTNCTDEEKTINHKYYESTFYKAGKEYWIELKYGEKGTQRHGTLSDTYLVKNNLDLTFDFPYYGHILKSVTLTTGGFLYMDVHDTKLITDVQYVAPLMAQFNTHLGRGSEVLTRDDGKKLTVQWSNVLLHDHPKAGPFTFQCTLHQNGTIWFAYKLIPIPVNNITAVPYHPVRVGISDAFVIRRVNVQQHIIWRYFYIYSEVNISLSLVSSGSAVVFKPKETCVSASGCEECIQLTKKIPFDCSYCPMTKRCSDGADRHREEWERLGCSKDSINKLNEDGKCPVKQSARKDGIGAGGIGAGGIVALCIVLVLICAVGAWCLYAYKYPNSRSGLFLIEASRAPRKLFSRGSGDQSGGTAAPSDVKPQVM